MAIDTRLFELSARQLKGVLFWAAIGISSCEGGAYPECEGHNGTVALLAKAIGFQLNAKPIFKERPEPLSLADVHIEKSDKTVSTEPPR
jgi:hypothetical protein